MSNLPDYLVFKNNATANEKQMVVCGNVRFSIITDRLIRIEQGEFCDSATLSVINRNLGEYDFEITDQNGVLTITTESLAVSYKKNEKISKDSLSVRLNIKPFSVWHFGDSAFKNLGGTISTLDQINGECPIDDGVCAIDGFSVVDDTKTPIISGDGWFSNRNTDLDIYFFGYGRDYTSCVKDYYRLTGIPEMLPSYALGNWWSRYYKYTADNYINLMDEFKKRDYPFSVAIVDMDWHLTDGDGRSYKDGWTGYTWNKELFPDYKEFLNKIKERNLKTALNLHPADGVRAYEEMYPQMAKALGVDEKTKKDIPFNCLSKEFWKAYFEVLHFPYEKDGVDFWWIDWQQGTNYWWIHEKEDSPKDPLEVLNPLWLLNHFHYLASKKDGKRGLIFSRFSGFGSQRYPIGFSGDTVITWDSLNFQPYFTVTASNVGYGWWSHDIGGHMQGYRDDELNTRWIQFGVFSPIFRLHSSSNIFLGREPWNYNKRAELVIKDFMTLRHKLFPYLYTMNYRNFNELLPLMRPMYHEYPEEKDAYSVKNEYWFGSELVVVPITSPADKVSDLAKAEVWLPKGKWIDWFSGYIYNGGKKTEVYRSLEQMPIFIKAGGIIPMQKHVESGNKLGNSSDMEIVIAGGNNGEFILYEDDGETNDYKNGVFCKTPLTLNWSDNEAQFKISQSFGDLKLIPDIRNYTLYFRGFKKGCIFQSDKNTEVNYDEKTNTYQVKLNDVSAVSGATIKLKNADGLLHDNSDWKEKVIEILTKAQCTTERKDKIFAKFENIYKEDGHFAKEIPFSDVADNNLAKAVFEIYKQI